MHSALKYTAEEIFAMFKEEHRLCSPLDPMADVSYPLTPNSFIWEWRACRDLLEWEELSDYLNQRFNIKLTRGEWYNCFEPEDKRTIMDVCRKIAVAAVKPTIPVKKPFGQECQTASVFLFIKENLRRQGINVAQLRPSTPLSPYLVKHFSPIIKEILSTSVRVFDEMNYSVIQVERQGLTWFKKLLFSRTKKVEVFYTGRIVTFGDAVKRICEGQRLITE